MDSDLAAVFRDGPFDGRLDTISATRQPRYLETRDGGWALYVLTDDYEGGRRVLRFEHGSESDVRIPERDLRRPTVPTASAARG